MSFRRSPFVTLVRAFGVELLAVLDLVPIFAAPSYVARRLAHVNFLLPPEEAVSNATMSRSVGLA